MRILLVCLGNICRSPTAEAALREALADAGMTDVEVDSAGTGDWHLGRRPDARMTEAAAAVGLTLAGTARQIAAEDFDRYDLILAMDRSNLRVLRELAADGVGRDKVRLYRDFEPDADADEVPDPYYGGSPGFARVVEIARAGAGGIVAYLRQQAAS